MKSIFTAKVAKDAKEILGAKSFAYFASLAVNK